MTNSQQYFLIVAEELNIGKAAKRAYISPQALSEHIRRLEEYYGVLLFHRKPHLILTPEGEEVLRTLRKIRMEEKSLELVLSSLGNGTNSNLRIAVHEPRANLMLPWILPRFYACHPDVSVSVVDAMTNEQEKLLRDGEVDISIGYHPFSMKGVVAAPLQREVLYLGISDTLLRRYHQAAYPACITEFSKGVLIENFQKVPFILFEDGSYINFEIQKFLKQHAVSPKVVMQTSSAELQANLAGLNVGACFCRSSLLPYYRTKNAENPLHLFPILGIPFVGSIVIAHRNESFLPQYIQTFLEISKQYASNFGESA